MRGRTTLACTVAVMASLLVSADAAAQWGRGRGPGWQGPGWGTGYGNGWGGGVGWVGGGRGVFAAAGGRSCLFGPRTAYLLGLTRPQQTKIDALFLKATDDARPLLHQLDRTEVELMALLASQKYDDKAALRLRRQARDLADKVDEVWSKYRQQVLAVLTPEQRQHYDELAAAPGPYGGVGYGRGYGNGWGWGGGRGWGRGGRWRARGWGW